MGLLPQPSCKFPHFADVGPGTSRPSEIVTRSAWQLVASS